MSRKADNPIFQSLVAAFSILLMHVLLLAFIAGLVLLFYGIENHMVLVVLGLVCLSAGVYWIFRRIRSEGKELRNMAGGSFKGKAVEISFLGGVATFKIDDSKDSQRINSDTSIPIQQLEGPKASSAETLTELASMYEKNLITHEEYVKAKESIFK